MTDPQLLSKKLAFIESCVADLDRLARPEQLETDLRERRFIEHTLQLAIQATLDIAAHIVSDNRLGEPKTNRHLFEILALHSWIDAKASLNLGNMAGFRNVLVHGYDDVDLEIVRDVLNNHLEDLTRFATAIRTRLR